MDKISSHNLNVLYVEDHEGIREKTTDLLNMLFKRVIVAQDGQDGVDTFEREKSHIDLIISDINMPKLSGIEMMAVIKEIDNSVPFIFLTAFNDNEYLHESIKLQANSYVMKPLIISELKAAIDKAITTIQNKKYEEELLLKNIEQDAIMSKLVNIIRDENTTIDTIREEIKEYPSAKGLKAQIELWLKNT